MLPGMVRNGTSEDFGSATELLSRVWPYRVGSERGLLHSAAAEPPDAHRRYWAAERDGELVGWATAGVEYQSSERPGFVHVSVAPELRGAGLGTTLLERCEAHLAGVCVATVLSFTTAEEASRRFATARGFRHTHTTRISGVDPRTVEPPREVPPGVALHPLAVLEPRKVYEVDAEAMTDVPGDVAMDDVSFEQWLEDYWRHPDTDLDVSMAAVVDGRPVSFSHLRSDPGGRRAVTDMTGTLRAYRGRGIELVSTENDETNAAMLSVNRKLGYLPVGTTLRWSQP